MGGLIQTVIQPNMERLMEDVQQGTLDYVLTKPDDAQLLVSVRECQHLAGRRRRSSAWSCWWCRVGAVWAARVGVSDALASPRAGAGDR